MATIFSQATSQAPQATAQTPSSDPLFDALVKYVTQGPGASSVTPSGIEDIINQHNDIPGGRAYLESIVTPDPTFPTRIWRHMIEAHGFVSTNMDSLTLNFTSTQASVRFRGTARGFFRPSVWEFTDAQYFFDEQLDNSMPVHMEVRALVQHKQVIVDFFPQVQTEKKAMAQLVINNTGLFMPPQGVDGNGNFELIATTQ